MPDDFTYVREYYDVPACLGRRVEVYGKPGVIAADRGHHIGVNFDSDKPGVIASCHPTSEVKYLGMGSVRKLSRSQQRYLRYLDVGDCFDDFHHFLKYCKD
ncbi:hypothetical protein ACFOY8_12690 [Thalassospira xianhensis]|uniref:hypothetical protein n=1 Tax=Thalassospira xianhensis TaxID=478503 RepID=UPI000DED4EF5|nr:hypothetical protein [Thalassospira xianhensis]